MESFFERQAARMIEFALGGTRGGPTRARIMREISRGPMNTNQISKALMMDYKTTEYHLRVLGQNGMVVESGAGYGSLFSPSRMFKKWEKAHKARGGSKR